MLGRLFFLWMALILVLNPNRVASQANDSLIRTNEALLQTGIPDTQKVRLISELTWEYSFIHPHKAVDWAQKELQLAQKLKSPYWISMAYNDLAIPLIRTGRFTEAIKVLEQSLRIRERLKRPDLVAAVHVKLGQCLAQTGQVAQSLQHYDSSLLIYKALGDKTKQAIVIGNIGLVLSNTGDASKAIPYFRDAMQLHQQLGSTYDYWVSAFNLANSLSELRQFDASSTLALQASTYFAQVQDPYSLASAFGLLGFNCRQQQQHPQGLKWYRQAYALSREQGDSSGMAIFGQSMGSAMLDLGMPDSALPYIREALEISRIQSMPETQKLGLASLLHYQVLAHQNREAVQTLRAFEAAIDSLKHIENARAAQELDIRYATEERERNIAFLNNQNRLRQLEIAHRDASLQTARRTMLLLAAMLVLLLVSGALGYSRIRIRNRLKMSEALALEQQRSLNAVIDASEEERQTIGRELHDSVGQQLSALKFLIESEPKASAILDSSIQEVRQISRRMLPVTLRHSGLDAALRELTENSFRHTPLAATYESWDLPEKMSEKGALQVYRIAQEIISNVLRHSGATQFQLLFYKAGAQLILRSEDNGVGNPTIAGKAGMGRSNIRARSLNLNAGLSEEHAVEGGWVTTVRIPLQSLQS